MDKSGRIVYAFVPSENRLEKLAKPAGPRPVLLSYYLLKTEKTDPIGLLEKWWNYSRPYTLIIDSGVYSLRKKLGVNSTASGSAMLKELREEDWKKIRGEALKKKSEVDAYVAEYISFLKKADSFYTVAIEMDLDYEFGIKYSDEYYEQITSKIDSKRIMRIWHHQERTFEDWLSWCNDPKQDWLGIEGGTVLSRDIDLYNRFIQPAHDAGKKVHILAMTVPQIFRDTLVTTADSSSFVQQAQYGTVRIPILGSVYFGHLIDLSKIKASDMCYKVLRPDEAKFCDDYLASIGFTAEDAMLDGSQGFFNRAIMNLLYYDKYVDIPYAEKSKQETLF